jgi:hypothetical protein
MAYQIFKRGGYFYIIDVANGRERKGLANEVKVSRGTTSQDDFYFKNINDWDDNKKVNISEIQDANGFSYTLDGFIRFYENTSSVDVNIQDSTANLVIVPVNQLITETTLSTATSIDDLVINVVSATSFLIGQLITIYSVDSNRVYFGYILGINGTAISLDSHLDYTFSIGDFVSVGNDNLSVDGSVTPQVFGVRNPTTQDIPLAVDVTRIIFTILTNNAVDLSKFGDIVGGITRGVLARKVNGVYKNIFNVKTNADFKNIMFDIDIEVAKGNAQDGITARFTFAGQENLGAVIRLFPNEDLQFIIQDDLSSLSMFKIMVEGSEVTI